MSVSYVPPETFRGSDTTRSFQSKQTFVKAQIAIHKLRIITALTLLPLIAWHNAIVHVFETYNMPRHLVERLRAIGLAGPKTPLWVALWILVGENSIAFARNV